LQRRRKRTVASIRRSSRSTLTSRRKRKTRRSRPCSWTGSGWTLDVSLLELVPAVHGVAVRKQQREVEEENGGGAEGIRVRGRAGAA
jgi:hypothetical protein